jgi:hypothetical protein
MDAIAEIKKIYYAATKATIQDDLARAIDLLKTLPTDDDRERVAVYMDGLSQMRSEWSASARARSGELRRDRAEAAAGGEGGGGVKPTSSSRPRASGPQGGAPRGRSGPSRSSSRRYR